MDTGELRETDELWVIDEEADRIGIHRGIGLEHADGTRTFDSEGPTLRSRADVDALIAQLRAAADRVFPA